MQLWNGPDFHCQQFPEAGSTDLTVGRCWGPVCRQDSDCPQAPTAQVCKNLFDPAPTQCAACVDGTCNCLFGQCVPAHGYVAGGM